MRQKWIAIATSLMLMGVSYVLAYAPYLKYRFPKPEFAPGEGICQYLARDDGYILKSHHPAFTPVELLIDHTPLQTPLLAWSKVWGCEDKMRGDMRSRHFDRNRRSQRK